jgi:hypothetical protein
MDSDFDSKLFNRALLENLNLFYPGQSHLARRLNGDELKGVEFGREVTQKLQEKLGPNDSLASPLQGVSVS